jgi:hypothetical protein
LNRNNLAVERKVCPEERDFRNLSIARRLLEPRIVAGVDAQRSFLKNGAKFPDARNAVLGGWAK